MNPLIDDLDFNLIIVRIGAAGAVMDASASTILHVNRSAGILLDRSETELVGQSLTEVFATGKEMILWRDALHRMDSVRADNCFEGEVIGEQGRRIRVLFSLSSLPGRYDGFRDVILLIQAIRPDNDLLMMHRVVEHSTSAVMITDAAGRIEYVNPKFLELSGYSADELLGKNPNMLQSGQTSSTHYRGMWETLSLNGEWRGELQNLRKNGEVYWVYESISAIKNSAGEITHYVAVEEDISQRKRIETALSESEERFRQMAEMTGEWLWEQDPDGYYLYSSSAVRQILGYGSEHILGKHYTAFLTTQDQETQLSYAQSSQPFYALINHYRHRDGRQILTESTGLPIFNGEGKLVKWRGVDRDITARMHFQEALVESEKRIRLIIESSLNAIVIMDAYGIVTDWNRRAEKMFGWSSAEAIGQRLDEMIIPARFREAHREGMRNFLRTGQAAILNKQTEQIALRRDGSEFPVEVSVSPLKLGNTYIFSGFIHDISSRKAAEEQIRQSQVNLAIAQNEIRIAQQIQATLSPSAPIKTKDFEILGARLTADKVGGDYFDYFCRNESHLEIAIADVSGHSIGPALFMVETRSAIRAQTNSAATPSQTLAVLNNFLFEDLDKSDYFITLFYLQADIKNRQIRYTNAGHPPPLLYKPIQQTFIELDADGLILGIKKDVAFEEKTLAIAPGDLIIFYTDGLTEAENDKREFFGVERIKAVVHRTAFAPPEQIIDALLSELKQFRQKTVFEDDITLMVFKAGQGEPDSLL